MRRFLVFCAALPLTALSSCSININGIGTDTSFDFTETNSESVQIEVGNVSKIDVELDVGQCRISYGESEKAEITGNYTCNGINEKKVSAAIENIRLKHEIKNDTLYIKMTEPDIGLKFVNYITDLEITLPKSFSDFTVSTDVGDIELDELSGCFDISADVGKVNAENIAVTGDSKIEADVGDIDISIMEVSECDFEIAADVGDIDFDANELEYSERKKSEDYVSKEYEIVIDGKCSVELKTDVGDIKIKK